MNVPAHIRRVSDGLLSRAELLRSGAPTRSIVESIRSGALVRVARGWFVQRETWDVWFADQRHLAAVIAAHRSAKSPPLFSHHSAAVLHGLPLWGLRHEPVHTISGAGSLRNGFISRHDLVCDDADVLSIAGIRCTGLDRTLADLASRASEEMLVGCADAVLRATARDGRAVDAARCESWRELMRIRARSSAGARGVRGLRCVIEFADANADSPLESVSRLHFARLNISVEVQVRVVSPSGGTLFVDFRIPRFGILGEADGNAKYTDPEMLGGMTVQEALLREKRRENWISGVTGERMIHWGARDAASTERFAEMLRAFNVPLLP